MKKVFFLACLLLPLFVLSCTSMDNFSDDLDADTVTIPIKLAGFDFTQSMEPMTRADNETVTYFFFVTQDNKPYAWYCMHSFENVTISLVKGHEYKFTGYVAYNQTGDYYWRTNVGNGISYLYSVLSNGFEYNDSMEYSLSIPIRSYQYKMLVCEESFSTIPEAIALNMYNAYYGVKVNVTNLKEGSIGVSLGKESNTSYAYNVTMDIPASNPSHTEILHYLYPLQVIPYAKEGTEFTKNVDISIKYTDGNGSTSVLYSGTIPATRMKYTILNLNLGDDPGNRSACNLSFEGGSMIDGQVIPLEF